MPPGSASTLETRRDVDAIAEDIVVLDDHVAQIDADAELDPSRRRHIGIAQRHPALDFGGARHGVNDAAELDQHAVTGRLDDAPRFLAMAGSMSSRRWVLRRASVPASSTSISRL